MNKPSDSDIMVKTSTGIESDSKLETSEDLEPSENNVAIATKGGREISNKILHISSLHKSIDEEQLYKVFSKFGTIKLTKVLNDKNKIGFNYAFIEFIEPDNALKALNSLNNTEINKHLIVIKWAYNSSNANSVQSKEPVYNIFVGDLSAEVDDESLTKAFSEFKSVREAHVMWDMQTSRSRGYGFVTFLDQQEAHIALNTMNGKVILGRAIRCNWAAHKMNQNQHNNFRRSKKNTGHILNHQHVPPYVHQLGTNIAIPGFENQLQPQTSIPNYVLPSVLLGQQQSAMSSSPAGPANASPYPIPQASVGNQSLNNSPTPTAVPIQSPNESTSSDPITTSQQHAKATTSAPNDSNTTGPPPFQFLPNDLIAQFNTLAVDDNSNSSMRPTNSFDMVLRQTPNWQTTVYIGNIAHFTTQNEIIPLVQNFGYLVDFKFHPDKGCAFAKFDTHERAALAIVQLAGFNLNGRPLKCGWGRDRPMQFRNMPPGHHQRS